MPPTNTAAYLPGPGQPMTPSSAPYTTPLANELLIRAHATAVNPVDSAMQRFGIILAPGMFPSIVGCDVAGEVIEVGSSMNDKYKVGDRVLSQGDSTAFRIVEGEFKNQRFEALFKVIRNEKGEVVKSDVEQDDMVGKVVPAYAAFQTHVVVTAPFVGKLPEGVSYEDAVVLPLAVNTAGSCLFMPSTLGLQPPTSNGSKSGKGTLLVWGASSSVGSAGVQLATQAGYEVVAVARKHNHDLAKEAGAKACFDYSDADVVDQIVAHLKDKDVVGVYDAISTDATLPKIIEILDKADAKNKFVAAVMPGVEAKSTDSVKIATNMAGGVIESGIGDKLWQWLEVALKDGRIKCLPKPEIVSEGLENVQKACDKMAGGVSGTKLVVKL
jgi:NADPH:quinone reductase-like Zn-dependent oxidoreductase